MLRRTVGSLAAVTSLLAAVAVAGQPGLASAQGIGSTVRADDLATLRAIGVPSAWRASRGQGVTVAVLDTGVGAGVADLAGSVTTGPDYTAGANPPGYRPPHLHGTYIASIIAGHGSGPGRAAGMIGVAPRAKILSVRVILDDSEPGFFVYNENANYDSAIAQGIVYAVRHGATVINMSLGGPQATRSMRLAIGYAVRHRVLLVAAAGNDGTAKPGFTRYSYPAAFPGVIAVAAVDRRGKRASFSNRNSSVVVSAPGVNVVGDGSGGGFLSGSGTSPASAFVAGVAALIRSKYPRLTPVQVMQAIVTSAHRRPPGGYNPGVGFGEINAAAALTAARELAGTPSAHSAGLTASAHFGGRVSGPIIVVPHNTRLIIGLVGAAAAGLLGWIAAISALVVGSRRRRRLVKGELVDFDDVTS
jgi:type VII secretion-associated serine protease mycosin